MQKHTLTQNKLEKASVLQHCYPEFDLGEKKTLGSLGSIVYESINRTHF
jgi:hypothetical protein